MYEIFVTTTHFGKKTNIQYGSIKGNRTQTNNYSNASNNSNDANFRRTLHSINEPSPVIIGPGH